MHGDLTAQDVALFAISYDSVDILGRFAKDHAITFPLLSDTGSHVIRRLGLLNSRVQEDHAFYGIAPNPRHVGVPYPGVFVLGRNGVITAKRFHESYRVRDTGGSLLWQLLELRSPAPGDPSAMSETDAARVRAWLDSPTYAWFQQLQLTVDIDVRAGLHIYGRGAPESFVPPSVDIEPQDGIQIGPAQWPDAQPLLLLGASEPIAAHTGRIRVSVPLTFTAPPGTGDRVLRLAVTFQASTDSSSSVPSTVTLELPVKEVALVGRSLPGPAS